MITAAEFEFARVQLTLERIYETIDDLVLFFSSSVGKVAREHYIRIREIKRRDPH